MVKRPPYTKNKAGRKNAVSKKARKTGVPKMTRKELEAAIKEGLIDDLRGVVAKANLRRR